MKRKHFSNFLALFALLMMLMLNFGIAWGQTVTTNDVTNITAYTATGNGSATGNRVGERGICWGTGQNLDINNAIGHGSNGTGSGSFSVGMTGLTPNTTYYWCAYAINSRTGNYVYGGILSFTTLALPPAVTTVGAIHVRGDYAVGLGNVTDDGYDPETVRGVCWSSSNQTPTIADSHGTSGTGEGNYSVEMTGLQPNTTYYMRAYAQNSAGLVYGEVKTFHTHVHMQNGTIEVNDAGFTFSDSDADDGWYVHYEDYTLVFIPESSSNGVKIEFESLLINNDFLYFYDGDISDNNLIGVFTCNEYHAYQHGSDSQISVFGITGNIFTVTSHSYMTVRFVSDYHWRDAGWTAHVSQVPFTPQPPAVAKLACTNDTFVLLPTSKGQHSTTLKYDIAYGGAEPGEANTVYNPGTPITISGSYPVKIRVKTEIMESASAEPVSSVSKVYTFGNESLIVSPNAPEFTPDYAHSSVTISVVRPDDLNDTWRILYTLDGTDPTTSSTAQTITTTSEDPVTHDVTTSGTVALPDFCTVKAVVQGTTCPEFFSDEKEFEYESSNIIHLLPPTITFDGNGNTASTTITPSTTGCVIHYTVNGGAAQIYNGPFTVNANDRVEAWLTKTGNYDTSPRAVATYLPGDDNPGSGGGLYGDVVYLDDREPHSWNYYSDENQPVHSLHPADVKITYFGFGNKTMTTTNTDVDPNNNAFDGNVAASDVAVGPGPGNRGNQFVYYETLEAGAYVKDPATSGYVIMVPDYEGEKHDYPYSLIPNPFSVRPTHTNVVTTRNIYVRGTIQDNAFGYIVVTYIDANSTQQIWSGYINWEQQQGSIYPEATLQVLAGTTVSYSLYISNAGWTNSGSIGCQVRYDDANGALIWNGTAYYNNNGNTNDQNNPVTGSTTVQAGGSSDSTITSTDYRGFYRWRVKRLKGVTLRDANGTNYDVNSIIPAETRLIFHTENEYGNEVDFEALWAKAYVVTSNTTNGLNQNVSYERNFVVGETNIGTTALGYPVTYSSYYPDGTQATNSNVTLGTFTCDNDTKFEYMNLDAGGSIITANNHYLCFGRGINTIGAPTRVQGIGENKTDLNYTIRIESGVYYRFAFVRDQDGTNVSGRYLVQGILGSDYDRANNKDNSKLYIANFDDGTTNDDEGNDNTVNNRLFFSYGVNFGGRANKDIETFSLLVKSGSYQKHWWKNGGNGRYNRSFYLGQNNAGATYPGVRYITVKGGEFGGMNGGRGTNTSDNATPTVVTWTARIKGGTFHGSVFGAAADNEAPGSRRIVITRAQVEGWVAGGCNGTGEQTGTGSTNGNSYIYVGGESIIGRAGDPLIVNTTPGGNVFGAGRGIDTRLTSINNSYVVVGDNAYVYNDVYGGGYHGYITTQANVYIVGGTVGNDVFGGAYEHGQTPSIPATRVYIRDGHVKGSVYGGSNTKGDIGENNAIIEMTGGTVGTLGSFEDGCVFGGGLGLSAHVKSNTIVTVNGGLVVNNVYGGGNRGLVEGKATVNIVTKNPDDIGAQIGDVHDDFNPTKGNVYGGGKGVAGDGGNTYVKEAEVNIIGSYIMGSVFGGGENGHVLTNTVVNVEGGQVGGFMGDITEGGEHEDCKNPYHGSVYGGGSGLNLVGNDMVGLYHQDGWVMGNATVNIVSGAHIMRNVYGGSNVASVGQYQGSQNATPSFDSHGFCIPTGAGLATVNISGGIIGTDGHNKEYNGQVVSNGMVFGSSHGKAVIGRKEFAHVNNTHVIVAAGADIRGSVFGGGDDGFVLGNTLVEIIDGTIGTSLTAEESKVDKYGAGKVIYTGNVYGGGRGIDLENGQISQVAGFVKGNTEVRMTGGLVRHNVYGGGSLANVGFKDNMASTGQATVHISGGQVGSTGRNNGRVFGSGRGMPANPNDTELMKYADLSNTNNTFVTVDGSAKVMGSVFGGGENGHVLKKTLVNIDGQATIGSDYMYAHTGNVYGGGRGVDRYVVGADSLFSFTAGKVFESTEVNVMNGLVYHHVYGGGDMASVGLRESDAGFPDPVSADFGLATVVVSGGVIGVDGNNNGHVFGSSHGWAGQAFKELAYTRNTDVTITSNALVHGSVFGSGEDGHVLKDTHVTIEGNCVIGTIGDTGYEGNVYGGGRGTDLDEHGQLSPTAGKTFGNTVVDMTSGWVKGSVFGGGRVASVGIEDEQPDSDGNYHTGHTLVTISGGEVGTTIDAHDNVVMGGNVYGGGKGFAGAPFKGFTYTKNTEVHIQNNAKIHGSVFGGGEDGHTRQTAKVYIEGGEVGDRESQCTNRFHGNVYGGGRGIDFDASGHYSWTAGRVNWSTEVNVSGGRVFRNVYGGGNIASVGLVVVDPDTDEVLLKPNHISQLSPFDLVPVDKFGHPRYTYHVEGDQIVWDETPNPLFGKKDANSEYSDDNLTGWARVNITGGVVGSIEDQDHEHGNVFGSCHGKAGAEYQHLSFVINTDVHVDYAQYPEGNANNIIQGSVFGGGEDGHVNMNTKVTVNAGKIGNMENDDKKGNVYGGGRGVDEDEHGQLSPSAGLVKGHTRVYINGGYISNSVFAGANMSAVWQEKVVNINGGKVKGSVYGGSKNVPLNRLRRGLKTVNVRNGHIYGNVYGCSQASRDGSDEDHPSLGAFSWTAFVNISGGLIDGNVHGAGYSSLVNGSTSIHIGRNAILYAKNHPENLYYNDRGGEEPTSVVNGTTTIEPKVNNPLIIKGSVYGGSDYYGSTGSNDWSHYDVNGITNMLIDGKGYNTMDVVSEEDEGETPKYMRIGGGLYGCSTHCESGTLGRHILLRNYGTRNVNGSNEMTSATRTLTTIQRCNDLIIDNANINLSGLSDIAGVANRNYAVLKVDDTLYMANASAFNLGTRTSPAYMDSIFAVRSLHLISTNDNPDSIYVDYLYKVAKRNWEWIGVAPLNPTQGDIIDTVNFNTNEKARLYYRTSDATTALTYDKENVILFNGDSRLWVRYHKMEGGVNKQLYGELQGFFRMKSPFMPHGTESFAYARPKTTANNNNLPQIEGQELYINTSDGGFLSYEIVKNFFTKRGNYGGWDYPVGGNDGGAEYTRTKQYPYTNVLEVTRGVDVEKYREWVIPEFTGKRWYVDGRGIGNGGWGMDKRHQEGWGHYPDMPKETVSGGAITGDNLHRGGVCYDDEHIDGGYAVFHPAEDIIYVVGPISAAKEMKNTTTESPIVPEDMNRWPTQYTLRLYRYPGGHVMSNGQIDNTVSTNPSELVPDNTGYVGFGFPGTNPTNSTTHEGPGANVNAMLNVETNASVILNNVYMDGLYDYESLEVSFHEIPTTFKGELGRVNEPLAVTYPSSTLTMRGNQPIDEVMITKYGTTLRRGCNNLNAYEWYTNPDYNGTSHHGGGIYVNDEATVNVESLVTVDDNLQTLQYSGSTTPKELIKCNVYLPTFTKHLWMTDELTDGTNIGITSPIRNDAWHYIHNTFSPVAVANKVGATDAQNVGIATLAYTNNNFFDDLEWFFVNNHRLDNPKTTYYSDQIEYYDYNPNSTDLDVKQHFDPSKTLFFGWTWNNVVRREPTANYLNSTDNFAYDNINSPEDLAWLISLVNGLNRQVANTLSGVPMIKQTEDVDMKQYVWLPIGAMKSGCLQFGGKFDGQGHLINHLDIAYIGDGDRRYERHNYGLFGGVNNGTVDRTFVTSGYMKPVGAANIGGLTGTLDGANGIVSNSEASVDIHCFDNSNSVSGGLVGVLQSGEIHSSMAMPVLNAGVQGTLGGLVGKAESNTSTKNIRNSFVNATYKVGTSFSGIAGGLVGTNYANVANCYVHLVEYSGLGASFGMLIGESAGGEVTKCYASKQTYTSEEGGTQTESEFPLSHYVAPSADPFVVNCYRYTSVMDADILGYMYFDNVVDFGSNVTDVIPLFDTLNGWVARNNASTKYANWARPTIPEINGDLPVLMLCDNDGQKIHQGNFSSLATYNGGHTQTGPFAESDSQNPGVVLQYGGTIRDNDQLNSALNREKVHATDKDYLFVYGDVIEKITTPLGNINSTKGKVSVYEHAAITDANTLSKFDQTYVGVTFDNSCGHAYSTPGLNHIDEGQLLTRDWHMFSSPLSNAPLGFNYVLNGVNTNLAEHYTPEGANNGTYFNNPWPYIDKVPGSSYGEFTWLNPNTPAPNDFIRYWMKGWENSQSQNTDNPTFMEDKWEDGYFPSRVANKDEFGDGCVENTDEYHRYPYGMDMFCYYEPEPHWINFKRNGPNHWHSDESNPDAPQNQHVHLHLPYTEEDVNDQNVSNQNEDFLKIGKGYMFAIAKKTYLQSHGLLNAGNKNRTVTVQGREHTGWNLVGNPYHAYLDFDEFASGNGSIKPFYAIYDADGYKLSVGPAESAYLYYPEGGSEGGEYADQYLHPHQGFFIRSTDGTALNFNEGMIVTRENATNIAYRSWRPNYPLVNLYLTSEKGCKDVTVVEFHRPEWGGAEKQKQLRQGDGMFYAYHDKVHYAALFTKEGAERVPLWFEAKEDDVFTISWNTANGYFSSLYLIDNITGVRYDMLENNSYVFEGKTTDYYSRFYIVFDCLDVEENEEETETNIAFFDGSQWMVTGEGRLELIDLQGRILWNSQISGGQSRVSLPNVAKGLYFFRLVNSNEMKVQKIIIK